MPFVRNYPSADYHFIVFANGAQLGERLRFRFRRQLQALTALPTHIMSNDMVHYSKHHPGENINIFNCWRLNSWEVQNTRSQIVLNTGNPDTIRTVRMLLFLLQYLHISIILDHHVHTIIACVIGECKMWPKSFDGYDTILKIVLKNFETDCGIEEIQS